MSAPVFNRTITLAEYTGGGDHPRGLRADDPWIRSDSDRAIVVDAFLGTREIARVRLEWRPGETQQVPIELSHGLVAPSDAHAPLSGHAGGLLRLVDAPTPDAAPSPAPRVGARRGGPAGGAPASPAA